MMPKFLMIKKKTFSLILLVIPIYWMISSLNVSIQTFININILYSKNISLLVNANK